MHTSSERRGAALVFKFSPGAILCARFRLAGAAVGNAGPVLPTARDFRDRGERLRSAPCLSIGMV